MSSEEYLLSLLSKPTKSNYAETTFINQRVCPFVKYFKDRLTVKYAGKGLLYSDISSIQANNPANRDTMIYYYEVKINDIGSRGDISVGFADADFPLNKHPGWTRKSYGYKADGKVFCGKIQGDIVMPKFSTGCYVGCGINYFKREIFFTFNGKSYGPAFKDVELKEYYATIGLHSLNECVTFNFGAKPFKFDLDNVVLEEKREGIRSILKQPINHFSLHQIVQSYLYFHGYADTLEAFEKSAQIERKDIILLKDNIAKETDKKGLTNGESKQDFKLNNFTIGSHGNHAVPREMEIETNKKESNLESDEIIFHTAMTERMRSESFQIEFESPLFTHNNRKDSTYSELDNFTLNREPSISEPLVKKNSISIDFNGATSPRNGQTTTATTATSNQQQTSPKNKNPHLLTERAAIRKSILEGNIQDAINAINKTVPSLLSENPPLMKILHAQQFIEFIKSKDHVKAIEYAQNNLNSYQTESIYTLDSKGIIQELPIDSLIALICYPDPETSELKGLLTFNQRDLTADIINKEILRKLSLLDRSILEIMISHLTNMEEKFREQNSFYGEIFDFKV